MLTMIAFKEPERNGGRREVAKGTGNLGRKDENKNSHSSIGRH